MIVIIPWQSTLFNEMRLALPLTYEAFAPYRR